MNDKSLVSFVTAAEKGSFYKAAQVLFTTPQTIVQQMNQLEQEVGMPLFERSNKGIRLTQAWAGTLLLAGVPPEDLAALPCLMPAPPTF